MTATFTAPIRHPLPRPTLPRHLHGNPCVSLGCGHPAAWHLSAGSYSSCQYDADCPCVEFTRHPDYAAFSERLAAWVVEEEQLRYAQSILIALRTAARLAPAMVAAHLKGIENALQNEGLL